MTIRFTGLVRLAFLALLVLVLSSCSKGDGTRIFGHWHADRFKLQGLYIPIGPDIVITEHELHVLDTDVHVPIGSISEEGNEVVVNLPAAVGLSFYFEDTDRMFFDVPLAGKIHYQRVKDKPLAVMITPESVQIPSTDTNTTIKTNRQNIYISGNSVPEQPKQFSITPPASSSLTLDLVHRAETRMEENNLIEAQALLLHAQELEAEHPIVDYNLAILRMRQSNSEEAIRHLNEAFKHGFRAFILLDSNPDLTPLKSDVRYGALVSRYR
jgi:hypothetical protein